MKSTSHKDDGAIIRRRCHYGQSRMVTAGAVAGLLYKQYKTMADPFKDGLVMYKLDQISLLTFHQEY